MSENPDLLRGIGIPNRRITADTISTDTTATEAGPVAGQAVTASDLRIDAYGTPTDTLSLRAQTSGLSGREGARFAVRTGSEDWFGWDLPVGLRNRRVFAQVSGTTVPTETPSVAVLADGTAFVAESRLSGSFNNIRVWRQLDPDDDFTSTLVAIAPTDSSAPAHPAMVVVDETTVFLFYLVYDSSTQAQVRVVYTVNSGGTWTAGQEYVLPESIDGGTVTITRMSAAYSQGQVSLVLSTDNGTTVQPYQYASADLGSSFALVNDGLVDSLGTIDWTVTPIRAGGFLFTGLRTGTTAGGGAREGRAFVLPDAYTPIDEGEEVAEAQLLAISAAFATTAATSFAYQDDSGALWMYISDMTNGRGFAIVSFDGGNIWAFGSGDDLGSWWQTPTAEAQVFNAAAAYVRGAAIVAHYYRSASGGVEGGRSPAILQLGGYTSITLPATETFVSRTNGCAYSLTYAGMSDPTDYGFTENTGSGTASGGPDGDGWKYTQSTGTAFSVQDSITTGYATGALFHLTFFREAGSVFGKFGVSDGTNTKFIFVEWLLVGGVTETIRISDSDSTILHTVNSGVAADCAAAGGAEVIAAVSSSGYTVGVRPKGNNEAPFDSYQGTITTQTGTFEGCAVGYANATGAPYEFRIDTYARATDTDFATSIANDFTSPADLRGFPLSTVPRYVLDGVSLAAFGGPALSAQTWSVPIRYTYPIQAIHSDSPQDGWRSLDASAGQFIVWEIEDLDDGIDVSDNGLMYVYLDRVNWKQFKLEHTDGNGATYPIELCNVNLTTSFAFSRTGHQVQPAASGTDVEGPYFYPDQLVGCQIELSSGEVVPIVANSGGFLTSGSTAAHRCIIYVEQDSIDNTADTSGTATIWHSRAVVYIHRAKNPAVKIKLSLHTGSEPAPYTGDFRAGTIDIGSVRVFSRAYGWNRRVGYRSNVDVTTLPNGSTRAERKGPRVGSVQLRWNEGLITDQTCSVPVYSSTSTNVPVSSSRDTADVVASLPDPADVVTYHAQIPAGPDVSVILSPDPRQVMRLRLNDVRTWEVITGTEGSDEFVRIELDGEEVV